MNIQEEARDFLKLAHEYEIQTNTEGKGIFPLFVAELINTFRLDESKTNQITSYLVSKNYIKAWKYDFNKTVLCFQILANGLDWMNGYSEKTQLFKTLPSMIIMVQSA